MSDGLTRYRVRPMLDPDHPWAPSAEIVDDPKGGLVKAEEAEARINELESLREHDTRFRLTAMKRIDELEARLRAADELAQEVSAAADALDIALAAHREANNE